MPDLKQWVSGEDLVVAHFSTHSHDHDDDHDGDEEDEGDGEGVDLENSVHGAFIFHLTTQGGNTLISGIDYYEAREYSLEGVLSVEALVSEFLLALENSNITQLQSYITDDFGTKNCVLAKVRGRRMIFLVFLLS